MARIRTIKPEFWTDEKTGTLSGDATKLFIGMLNHADDYGVIEFNIEALRAKIFPYSNNPAAEVVGKPLMDELLPKGLVVLFMIKNDDGSQIDNKSYLLIPNFLKHQRIDRPGQSIIKDFKKENIKKIENTVGISKFDDHSTNVLRSFDAVREGKVMEGNGMECITTTDMCGKSKRFTPPTLSEIESYCSDRHNRIDARKFLDFYESKGWFVGKNKMKDWKAAIRTWEHSNHTISYPNPKSQEKPRISDSRPIPDEIKILFRATRLAKNLDKEMAGWDEINFEKEGPAAQKLLKFCCGDVRMAGDFIVDKGLEFTQMGMNWTLGTILRHAYSDEKLLIKIKEKTNVKREQKQVGIDAVPERDDHQEPSRGGEPEIQNNENRNRLNALVSDAVRKLPIPDRP